MSSPEISLREHLEREIAALYRILEERDRQYAAAFKAVETAVNAALVAQEKQTTAAFGVSERAITKAEQAQHEYNIRSNEFRGQLDDQAKRLMARDEALGLFRGINGKFEDVREAQTTLERQITTRLEQQVETVRSQLTQTQAEQNRRLGVLETRFANFDGRVAMLGVVFLVVTVALTILMRYLSL